jgi:fibrillarin-like pre-rRNA processing protein
MKIEKISEGIFKVDGRLATINLTPDSKVYGEELIEVGGIQYRSWNPYRSKLAAAISKGLTNIHMKPKSHILYLGAATGTTSSHLSDIVGKDGIIYCIEIAERSMRDLLKVCEKRNNMLPILQDARKIESYSEEVGQVDIIYQDVAARDQDIILLRNSDMLKKGGYAYVAIKSQSIDVSRDPKLVYREFLDSISGKFDVLEKLDLSPYDQMHLFVALRKK